MSRALLVLLLLAGWACVPRPMTPGSRRRAGIRLSWARLPGAERCPEREGIEREVIARRGGQNPFLGATTHTIDVVIGREPSWYARFYVRDRGGREIGVREVRDNSTNCDAMSAAAVAILSLYIDNLPPPPRLPKPAPPEPTVSAGFAIVGGLLPGAAPGATLRAEAGIAGPLRGAAEAVVVPPTTGALPGASLTVGFAGGSLGLCGRWTPLARIHLLGCGGAVLGALTTSVRRGSPSETTLPWGAAQVGLLSRLVLFERGALRLLLEVGAQAWVPFSSVRHVEGGSGVALFEPWPVAVVGSASVGLSFR